MANIGDYKYIAFISYKREDEKSAIWLQYKLEHYKLPSVARKNNPLLPKKVQPIFRDSTDLTGGVLEEILKKSLDAAKFLIVVCSPKAAQSDWVCKEVQEFIDSGRGKYIIPYIIEGEPKAKCGKRECFPENLRILSGSQELLGVNINEGGRDLAVIKIIAHILGLELGFLWDRWEREKKIRKRWITLLITLIVTIALSITGIMSYQQLRMKESIARAVTNRAEQHIDDGNSYLARKLLVEILTGENDILSYPYTIEAEAALRRAFDDESRVFTIDSIGSSIIYHTEDGKYIVLAGDNKCFQIININSGFSRTEYVDYPGKWKPMSFSCGGRFLTVSDGENVIIWDVNENRCINTFLDGRAYNAKVIANGKYVVSSGWRHSRLWDVRTGKCLYTLDSLGDFSSDAKFVLSVSGAIINIKDLYTNKVVKSLDGHTDKVNFAEYSPNGEYIVSSDNNVILLWNPNYDTKVKVATLTCPIYKVGFISNGKYILCLTNDKRMYIWRVKDCELVLSIDIDGGSINYDGNGKYLLYRREGIINVYSLSSGDVIRTYNYDHIETAALTEDSKNVVLYTSNGKVLIKPIESKMNLIHDINYGDSVKNLKISPNGKYVITTYNNKATKLWSLETGVCLRIFPYSETNIENLVFSNNSEYFITSDKNTFKLWSVGSAECLFKHNGNYLYEGFSFGNNDKYLVAWTPGRIELWSLETFEMINSRKKDNKIKEDICISQDGRLILYSTPQYLNILSTDSLKLIKSLVTKDNEWIRNAAINQKGDVLISTNKKFIVWNINIKDTTFQSNLDLNFIVGPQNGFVVFTNGGIGFDYYMSHRGEIYYRACGFRTEYEITHAVLSQNEDYIITACADDKVRIWRSDFINAKCVSSYDCNANEIDSIILASDGSRILIVTKDKRIKVIYFPSLQELIDKTREQFKNVPLTLIERLDNYLY